MAKAPFYAARHAVRSLSRAATSPCGQETLVGQLRTAGVVPGDVLCLHVSLASLGRVDGGAETVIDAFKEAVGPEGTLVMPAYGRADRVFGPDRATVDLRTAPSETGWVTEVFRTLPGTLRSSHPFASVCAQGPKAAFIVGGHAEDDRICHSASPLARVHQLGGKIVGAGITLGPVSFYHVVEDTWPGFPLEVYEAAEIVDYIAPSGEPISRPLRRYRADLVGRRIDGALNTWVRDRITDELTDSGALRPFTLSRSRSWMIDCECFYREIQDMAARNLTIYTTQGDADGIGPRSA